MIRSRCYRRRGPSALKILVEVPDYSEVMKSNLILTVLEAVRFKFSFDTYEECIKAMQNLLRPQFPIDQRNDVKRTYQKRICTLHPLDHHESRIRTGLPVSSFPRP